MTGTCQGNRMQTAVGRWVLCLGSEMVTLLSVPKTAGLEQPALHRALCCATETHWKEKESEQNQLKQINDQIWKAGHKLWVDLVYC